MDYEQTKEAIKVMQAYVDGEEIEACARDHMVSYDWYDCPTPNWDFSIWDYRIKPKEPRKYWIVFKDGSPYSKPRADYFDAYTYSVLTEDMFPYCRIEIIEVVENVKG